MENVIVLGNGFLGQEFKNKGYLTISRKEYEWGKSGPLELLPLIEPYDVVINTIAFTNTKESQTYPQLSIKTNFEFVSYLKSACEYMNKKIVHISTGCIYRPFPFDYTSYSEDAPFSVYTLTKLLGETQLDDNDLIIRPRLIFGPSPNPSNLFDKLKNHSKFLEGDQSFTSTTTIVEAVEELLKNGACGIFNVAQEGVTSIMEIAKILGFNVKGKLNFKDFEKEKQLTSPQIELNCSKLHEYYKPRQILDEITSCGSLWTKASKNMELS